jgi:hypothetical protein
MLLRGYDLRIQAIEGDSVAVEKLLSKANPQAMEFTVETEQEDDGR